MLIEIEFSRNLIKLITIKVQIFLSNDLIPMGKRMPGIKKFIIM